MKKKQINTTFTATKIQKEQIIKKAKTLVRSNSTEKITDTIKQSIEPARNLMEKNKDLDIDFDQLKNIITNTQGNADGTDAKSLLNTIETVRPAIKSQSLKNRLTRLSNKLLETIDLDSHEITNPETEDHLSTINNTLD